MPIAATPVRASLSARARAVAVAVLAAASLLSALPSSAAALEPPRPLPGYRPAFVTETDTRPWTDCLWASGAMLLDKWTNGDVRVTRQQLRAASGDSHGGSRFRDMKIAFAKYGFNLRFSPDGGESLTWSQLLHRLGKGAGAVVLGDDHKLPQWFGRWDYAFWKKRGKKDNHAVYIERYDAKHGRVWLMDPLGRDGWQGEWIPVWAIRKFAWTRGGAVFAAVTPTAKAAPFAKVRTSSTPRLVRSASTIDAAWSLKAPKRWRFPGADVTAKFVTAKDPVTAAAVSPGIPVRTTAATAKVPKGATVTVQGKSMRLTAPLPTTPGAYTLHLGIRDRRFGRAVVPAQDIAVFVPGDRRATLRLNARENGVEADSALRVSVNVANSGTLSWAGTWSLDAGAGQMEVERGTRAIATWVRLDDAGNAVANDATPDPVVLGPVPLEPGQLITLRSSLTAPSATGRWALVVDVVDDVDGSYAALGSQPAVTVIEVVEARGRTSVD
ncbi:MAG TPA: hypothetical protein VFQ75_02745 [Candidatus Limnocylindrales bacterium]|nr:hypothetical protein [Candidatus Limnocylindrales bacterium]